MFFDAGDSEPYQVEEYEDIPANDAAKRIIDKIFQLCQDWGYRVYYLRFWKSTFGTQPCIQFDFGSHTEFFYLTFAGGSETDAESFIWKFLGT